MQICAICGAENRSVARFCAACGQKLTRNDPGTAASATSEPVGAPAPATEEPVLRAGLDGVLSEEGARGEDPEPVEAPAADGDEPVDAAADAAALTDTGVPPAADRPAPPPLEPGVTVAGRWQITALQETADGCNTYQALDLAACPQCGRVYEPDEDFCSECGVELAQAGPPPTVALSEAEFPDALTAFGPAVTRDGDRLYAASAAGSARITALPSEEPQPLALTVGYASDRGKVRDLDEDSLLVFTLAGMFESQVDPSLGLFIVADGMGGHEGGEMASKEAVRKIADILVGELLKRVAAGSSGGDAEGVSKIVRRAIVDANTSVHELAAGKGIDAGTTVTLAAVVGGEAHIANVGDSRTFLFRAGNLRQVTRDHSLVASLVMAGVIEPDEIYTHPQRNAVYRSLGTGVTVEVDQFYERLMAGDALVLCCDGIWEAIRPEGIEEVLLAVHDPQAACNEMVRRSNAAGGDDNLSVIVVRAGA